MLNEASSNEPLGEALSCELRGLFQEASFCHQNRLYWKCLHTEPKKVEWDDYRRF